MENALATKWTSNSDLKIMFPSSDYIKNSR
ncbi:MAG: hypothetical protein IKP73_01895 [Bacteroidales bacterium]|nr:hypothetical protein [Bacteroidales bacterium]MBR4324261.1 hypothetical protein [Bacteroidales bacterium]